jgi:phospholipid/cholesterol/gamma-HCH transport system substrate-binding protein
MSNPNEASSRIKWRVGMFTMGAILFIGILSIYINNRPYWWRPCDLIQVTIQDATGLKKKSPVKSLGMDIGFISDIGLVSEGVKVNLCITAPVETTPDTKAYVRGEGFLGDKFLELKPVKYIGDHKMEDSGAKIFRKIFMIDSAFAQDMVSTADAQELNKKSKKVELGENQADMEKMMGQLNSVMGEVKGLTSSLKESINPDEIRGTIRQLNKTLEEAAKTFSPQGGLTQTAQRTLIKLEDTIEQFRDQMTRINQGQGSLGMILNDPSFADELKKAMVNMNKILNRASDMRLSVSLGVIQLPAYVASRGDFQVTIWPRPTRYYTLGLASDPRGTITQDTVTTVVGGTSTTVQSTRVSQGGFSITGMIGTVFLHRFDVAVGVHHSDGAASLGINLGPSSNVEMIQLRNEVYFRGKTVNGSWTAEPDARSSLILQPISIFFLAGGVDGYRKINGKISTSFGAGLRFDDEDIKLLFSFL